MDCNLCTVGLEIMLRVGINSVITYMIVAAVAYSTVLLRYCSLSRLLYSQRHHDTVLLYIQAMLIY